MPRRAKPLTEPAIKQAKPREKVYKLFDGGGLFLLVNPDGNKWWRLKYHFEKKERVLALGVYPNLSLKDARRKRDEARVQIANGIDPCAARKATKIATGNTASFEVVAREWHANRARTWGAEHAERVMRRFERDLFPWIGKRSIADIKAPELLAVLRRIENRGAIETAHRALQDCGQVFRYAVATGRAERDPSQDLRGALPPVSKQHFPSITDPKRVGELLRTIEGYQGSFVTRCALKLAPLLFVRPGELRQAAWEEFDLEEREWRIPAQRMKMKSLHVVPLSRQALAVLEELRPLTGDGMYLFPGLRTAVRPMSENTVNGALRRLGYGKEEMTGHGFRSMASTLLNEQGWNRDAIERQLAHAERDETRASYNYAEHLPERRRMMQAWADYLDGLKAGAKVIHLHRSA